MYPGGKMYQEFFDDMAKAMQFAMDVEGQMLVTKKRKVRNDDNNNPN